MAFYIDNKRFTAAVVEYRENVLRGREPLIRAARRARSGWKRVLLLAQLRKHRNPPISDYLGDCFLAIATHLAEKPCFRNSPYRSELVSEAIFDLTRNAWKFNQRLSSNAFGYFTRIAIRAFFRALRREERLNSRFIAGDQLPEPALDFRPQVVSSDMHDRAMSALLEAWINENGKNGHIRRGWAPVEEYEGIVQGFLAGDSVTA